MFCLLTLTRESTSYNTHTLFLAPNVRATNISRSFNLHEGHVGKGADGEFNALWLRVRVVELFLFLFIVYVTALWS